MRSFLKLGSRHKNAPFFLDSPVFRKIRPLLPRLLRVCGLAAVLVTGAALGQETVLPPITKQGTPGETQPIWVSISGLTGESLQVLEFDLYVQGFNFTNSEGAQYLITGNNNGNLTARAMDKYNKQYLVNHTYSGVPLRRQTHAFADEFVQARGGKGIAQTKIAFRGENGQNSEIYISDFDGHDARTATTDNSLAVAPCWVPGRFALYYTSYRLNHPDIYYQDLSSGSRKIFARYGGSNLSPAVSPDGSKVAMILSKDGWTDLYVQDASGGFATRLTKSPQDESSPCWSPDGRWICYASKERERRSLSKISPSGGEAQRISTAGAPNPTEPEWSPDGKWIVFTTMYSRGFSICVVPSTGGNATTLVEGEDASWAPNSRTVIFTRRQGGHRVLSLLDVMTKQTKDISQIKGTSSQSQPSWAR